MELRKKYSAISISEAHKCHIMQLVLTSEDNEVNNEVPFHRKDVFKTCRDRTWKACFVDSFGSCEDCVVYNVETTVKPHLLHTSHIA